MSKRKNKKNYYAGSGKRAKYCQKGYKRGLAEDMTGFILTCNNREKETTQEAYNLLNEYADRLYGPEVHKENKDEATSDQQNTQSNGDGEKEDANNSGDESDIDDDIDSALEKEKEQILKVDKIKPEDRRFQRVNSGASNVVFIKTTLQDPCRLVSEIIEDISVKKENKTRYIQRLIPVVGTCKVYEKNITPLLTDKLKDVFKPGEHVSYCIIFKCRNNNQVKQQETLDMMNSVIKGLSETAKVELDKPDLCLCVEVIRNIFCLGVARDYFKHRKYNLQEMVKPVNNDKPAKEEEKTDKNKDDKEEVSEENKDDAGDKLDKTEQVKEKVVDDNAANGSVEDDKDSCNGASDSGLNDEKSATES